MPPTGRTSTTKPKSAESERSRTWFPFDYEAKSLEETKAYAAMLEAEPKSFKREVHGDRLAMKKNSAIKVTAEDRLFGAFASLYQGDHLGVEFALESHTDLQKGGDLLRDDTTILRGRPLPNGPCYEGLVIDDYFSVSREPAFVPPECSLAVANLEKAEEIYKAEKVMGSDEKTVRGEERFKVIGAEVDSSSRCRDAGIVPVGAPLSRRIAMAMLSLRAARMPVISRALASRLAGNWVSIFMFRRMLSSTLAGLFGLGTRSQDDADDVVPLPRRVAEELVLSSVFALVATSGAMRRGLGVDADEDETDFLEHPPKALDFASMRWKSLVVQECYQKPLLLVV